AHRQPGLAAAHDYCLDLLNRLWSHGSTHSWTAERSVKRRDVSAGTADRAEAQGHAAGQRRLLGPRQRVEQDAVDIAIQALEVGAARVATATGGLDGQSYGVDHRVGSDALAGQRATRDAVVGVGVLQVVRVDEHARAHA